MGSQGLNALCIQCFGDSASRKVLVWGLLYDWILAVMGGSQI